MVSAIAERLRIRCPALAEGAFDVLAARTLTGSLTELEATLVSAILAAPPGQPITAKSLQDAQSGLVEADHAGQPSSSFDAWLVQALSKGGISMTEIELRIYRTAVDRAAGNLSAAARSLGLSRAQLAYRLDLVAGKTAPARL